VGEDDCTLSIVIPTYNELANIDPLFREFADLRGTLPIHFEIVIVDDGSPDGTKDGVRSLGQQYGLPVRVHVRTGRRGLGTAVAEGLSLCDSDFVCVMDADLSHPPILLATLLERLNGFDGVVASRYTAGGRIAVWPLHRRIISLVATRIAQSILKIGCADPLSGYFVFRTASIRGPPITGRGNKPLLEFLSRGNIEVFEVPYEFRNRVAGKSKLTVRAILEYVWLVLRLRRERNGERFPPDTALDEGAVAPRNS
jgi:dolichol-phosphate mannosyltransferase